MMKMNEVYVLVSDGKVNNHIYQSREEANGAIELICGSVECWLKDYPVKMEEVKIMTLYEYIKLLKHVAGVD